MAKRTSRRSPRKVRAFPTAMACATKESRSGFRGVRKGFGNREAGGGRGGEGVISSFVRTGVARDTFCSVIKLSR